MIEFGWTIPIGIVDKGRRAEYGPAVDRILGMLPGHFSSAWMTDHFQWDDADTLECMTGLTYWAGRHPELKFGPIVLGQSYRNPALLAKMSATLQFLTGGRFILGIGTGWKDDEYKAYGYPFPSAGVRVEQLEEALVVIKALWAASPGKASFAGQHYQVTDAWCEPAPDPKPPILIGGERNRMLRLVARHADMWNVSWMPLEDYRERLDEMKRACDEVGRDFATLRKTWFGPAALGRTQADAEKLAAGRFTNINGFLGTPDDVRKKIDTFASLGVDLFIFGIRGFPDPQPVELMISDVVSKVQRP